MAVSSVAPGKCVFEREGVTGVSALVAEAATVIIVIIRGSFRSAPVPTATAAPAASPRAASSHLLLKNFPGTLSATQKAALVEQCLQLGLRCLGSVYEGLQRDQGIALQQFADIISGKFPHYDRDKIVDRAQATLVGLAAMCATGIVKRVALAVGGRDLEKTYDRVLDLSIPTNRLIKFSISLDHGRQFPMTQVRDAARAFRGLPMSDWVLRSLAVEHFQFFPLTRTIKQEACKLLKIKFEQVDARAATLKLVR